jgi:hypothetical protein
MNSLTDAACIQSKKVTQDLVLLGIRVNLAHRLFTSDRVAYDHRVREIVLASGRGESCWTDRRFSCCHSRLFDQVGSTIEELELPQCCRRREED